VGLAMDFDETDNSSTTNGAGGVESPAEGESREPGAESSRAVQPAGAPAAPKDAQQRRTRLTALRGRRAEGASEDVGDGSESNADTASHRGGRGVGIRDLAKPGAANDPVAAGRSVLTRLTEHLNRDPSKSRTAFRSALAGVQRGYEALDKEIARLQAELERAQEAMRTIQRQSD
jgi:hypothetical protein